MDEDVAMTSSEDAISPHHPQLRHAHTNLDDNLDEMIGQGLAQPQPMLIFGDGRPVEVPRPRLFSPE
jgi:hypothetical protein